MVASLPVKVGDVVKDYRLERVLGQGGMGCVFLATHGKLGRKVAIKVLASELAASHEFVSRFLREARIVNDVRHANIIDITDFIETEQPRCIAYVMEYVEGPPLSQLVRQQALRPIQAINATFQLADALGAVHALGVVHRDLKPENILVLARLEGDFSAVPSVKVLDFGIAKSADPNPGHRTATGLMMGTPTYMAPEQIAAEPVSPATDIYALAEIFYEMLTGRRLFQGEPAAILKSKLLGELPSIELPAELEANDEIAALIRSCIDPRPQNRPDMAAFSSKLRRILGLQTDPGTVRAESQPRPPLGPEMHTPLNLASVVAESPSVVAPRRSPFLFGAAAALLGLTVALLGFAFYRSRTTEPIAVEVAPIVERVAVRKEVPGPETPTTVVAPGGEPGIGATPKDALPVEAVARAEAPSAAAATEEPKAEAEPRGTARRSKSEGAKVSVRSTPPGAIIRAEESGRILGTTPARVSIPAGKSKLAIRLELPGHAPKRAELDAGDKRVQIALEPSASKPDGREDASKKKRVIGKKELTEW